MSLVCWLYCTKPNAFPQELEGVGRWGALGKGESAWTLRARVCPSSKKVSWAGHGKNGRKRLVTIAVQPRAVTCVSGPCKAAASEFSHLSQPGSQRCVHRPTCLTSLDMFYLGAPCGPKGLNSWSVALQSLWLFPKSCGPISLYFSLSAQIPK